MILGRPLKFESVYSPTCCVIRSESVCVNMDCTLTKPKPFSLEGLFISKKIRKISKMVKPMLKLLSRRQRTNAVTPSCCNYDIEEAQNKLNEPFDLEFRFLEDENARNEALENRLRESVMTCATGEPMGIYTINEGEASLQPVLPDTYFAVPVHFVEAPSGGFLWVPIADADIAPNFAVTCAQLPSQQVPCVLSS